MNFSQSSFMLLCHTLTHAARKNWEWIQGHGDPDHICHKSFAQELDVLAFLNLWSNILKNRRRVWAPPGTLLPEISDICELKDCCHYVLLEFQSWVVMQKSLHFITLVQPLLCYIQYSTLGRLRSHVFCCSCLICCNLHHESHEKSETFWMTSHQTTKCKPCATTNWFAGCELLSLRQSDDKW